ncbi:MAG: hypothetical protein ACREV4_03480 [Gammaproteobacteria bacterium]
MHQSKQYRSIFSPSSAQERVRNFESYWGFSTRHAGELLEEEKDLVNKRERLRGFQNDPVRSRKPLADPSAFYRNYKKLLDDPKSLDRKTLLLTCIYKFARHEWMGIQAAWDAVPPMAEARTVRERISRVHLAEEFCHARLFNEMFRTFHLEVEWESLGPVQRAFYQFFARLPGELMNAPAFVTELMGLTFYHHLDAALDDILADEPQARGRLRALLQEIMVDELAHVGQRRNFIGPLGIRFAKLIVRPMYRLFFRDIPEAGALFDIPQMIREGLAFDYNQVSPALLARSWVPSYCRRVGEAAQPS